MQIDRYVAERRQKQKKRRKYFWGVAVFLSAYFVCFGIFAFIVRLPAFQAEKIVVQGNSAVPTSAIMDLLRASVVRNGASSNGSNNGPKALFGFDNMLIWPDALPSATLALIPRLAGITISKDYFLHTITVTVTERQPFAVWCEMPADDCYWFDEQGIAFERTFDTQGNAILSVRDYTGNRIGLNGNVLPDEFVPNMVSIIEVLKQSGLAIQEIALHDLSLQQVDVATANGPTLHFSLRFSAENDLPVLKDLIAKGSFDKLQYVDFTVENRAYYQ